MFIVYTRSRTFDSCEILEVIHAVGVVHLGQVRQATTVDRTGGHLQAVRKKGCPYFSAPIEYLSLICNSIDGILSNIQLNGQMSARLAVCIRAGKGPCMTSCSAESMHTDCVDAC